MEIPQKITYQIDVEQRNINMNRKKCVRKGQEVY